MIKDFYRKEKTLFSLEVFPPKKDSDFPAIYELLDTLKHLHPHFISVTYGAGGSHSKKTVDIASYIQNSCNIEALAHMTCVGCNDTSLLSICQELKTANVHHILALRGDRPKDMTDEQFHRKTFSHASNMVAFLKSNTDFQIAGACYPEKHFEAKSMDSDIMHLKEKCDAGVDFLISQLFFDNDLFYYFLENAKKNNIALPISAGIMPITTARQLTTTVSLSGSSVPKKLSDMIAKYEGQEEDLRKAGIEYAIHQIQDLLHHGVDGIHLYTMNKSVTASEIFFAVR